MMQKYDEYIGQQIGSYRVVRVLGRGGMGVVYEAEHPKIHQRVAIKMLHRHQANDEQLVRRFLTGNSAQV